MSVLDELFGVAGKSVLVTGGSRGIGRAMAEAFVKAGARVYVCSRDAESCNRTARELSAFGSCSALPCNVASDVDRKRMVGDFAKHEKALNASRPGFSRARCWPARSNARVWRRWLRPSP